MSNPAGPAVPLRSFKPRRRGLSPARTIAFERAMARWGIAVEGPPLSFADMFGDVLGGEVEMPADVVLDIGFGGGEAMIELADTRPDECVIGVDVHTPGIASVLEAIERRDLRNVRVVHGDVLDFCARIPARSLAAIRVFFPDPWPKRRQLGRRLIRADVLDRLLPLLRPGGALQLATDASDYALQMQLVCDDEAALRGGVIDRPSWRPSTRFEQRGIDEGRSAVDLLYIACEISARESSSAPR